MLTKAGIRVIEFNCRLGDPETQVVLPMLKSDLAVLMQACTNGTLAEHTIENHDGFCAAVVMAAPGYPASYPKGLALTGIEKANQIAQVQVFHAGTKTASEGLVTSGGRVLAVSGRGDTLTQALENAYTGVAEISFEGAHYRRDIGHSSLKDKSI